MRLILEDEQRGQFAHHMTAEWTAAGRLVFEDADARIDVGARLAWSGRDDYGTITQSGEHAALYRLPECLVIRIEVQDWVHDRVEVRGADHHVSEDGGRTWRLEPVFDGARVAGLVALSHVGV